MSNSYEMASRKSWNNGSGVIVPTDEQLTVGCLQRIATATEVMAKNYQGLITSRDWYEKMWEDEVARRRKQAHIIAGLRGCVARMKREAKRNRPLLRAIKLSGGAK
jgi:hypothetical protein